LPVDPMSHTPPGFTEEMRDQPGGFTGELDVFDTWFTSSLTPQIGSHWLLDPERHARLFPADLRPQSHEIIRTWAFYTIVKALLHEDQIPWHHIAISGWILDPDRKKMSKSAGNVVTPTDLLDEYSSDAVRYWAASARLGIDTAFDVKELKVGKRLSTKLFNAGKFVLSQSADAHPITHELDRAFLHRLRAVVERATAAFAEFDFARALMETEQFFWSGFTDTYIELVKARARGDVGDQAGRGSAVATLRLGLDILLRLFAPVLPYITEEVWSWVFASGKGQPSIHRAPWPSAADFAAAAPDHEGSLDTAVECLTAINKRKTEAGVSIGRVASRLVIAASPATLSRLEPVLADVLSAARCEAHELRADSDLADGVFAVIEAEFADPPPKS
jgi:valyl-tRNA synthetase